MGAIDISKWDGCVEGGHIDLPLIPWKAEHQGETTGWSSEAEEGRCKDRFLLHPQPQRQGHGRNMQLRVEDLVGTRASWDNVVRISEECPLPAGSRQKTVKFHKEPPLLFGVESLPGRTRRASTFYESSW